MKLRKIILGLSLALIMILSASTVSAADNDRNVYLTNGTLYATAAQMNLDDGTLSNPVNLNPQDYLYAFGGDFYQMSDAFAAFQEANLDLDVFDDILVTKDPVVIDTELKVESVSAINAKTLKVEFNKAVAEEDQAEATFAVTRNDVTVAVAVGEWNEAGDAVTLKRITDTAFAAGDYVVTVSGIELEVATAELEFEAQIETSMEITTEFIRAAAGQEVKFNIKDQYGDVWKDTDNTPVADANFIISVYNVTQEAAIAIGGAAGQAQAVGNDMIIDVDASGNDAIKVNDVLRFTVVYPGQDISVQKEIQVKSVAAVSTFELGKVVGEQEEEIIISSDDTFVDIEFTAFDQYGNKMPSSNYASASNVTVLVTGDALNTPVMGTPVDNIRLTVPGSLTEDKTSTVRVMVVQPDGSIEYSNPISVTVKAARMPASMEIKTTPATRIVQGQTETLAFDFIDQYGDKMAAGAALKANYNLEITKASEANTIFTAPAVAGADNELVISGLDNALGNISITAGTTTDEDTITFTLKHTNGTEIDVVTLDFQAVAYANTFWVQVDEEEYKAGDTINVTVAAQDAAIVAQEDYNEDLHELFEGTFTSTVTVGGKDYIRTLTFANGVATTTVPATNVVASNNLTVAFDQGSGSDTFTAQDSLDVVVGEASKFALAGTTGATTLGVTLQDNFGNILTTFAGEKILTVTHPAGADRTGTTPIDTEGNVVVNFTAGVGTITFGASLPAGDYTVTFGDYTGTLTVK